MHVLFLNQYFYPDLSSTAQIMTDLAIDLADAGVEVTVVTGRTAYIGEETYAPRERYRGIDIIRVPTTRLGRQNILGRLVDFTSFLASAGLQLARPRNVDVVVALSTPPLISMLGAARSLLSRARFVYWIQDLYPDLAVQLGVLSDRSVATQALDLMSRASMRSADAVVTIGECMADHIRARGNDPGNLAIIHNWADGAAIHEIGHADNWFRATHGLTDRFVCLYSGNMGRGHRFETLTSAMEELAADERMRFVFVGAGPKRGEIEAAAERIPSLTLLPYQPREHLVFSLGAADLAMITLDDAMTGLMVPSKLYGHLASARPILYIGPRASTCARIIEESGCGGVFDHGDVDGVVAFVRALVDDPERARDMGRRGRAVFDADYDRPRSTGEFSQLLRGLAG